MSEYLRRVTRPERRPGSLLTRLSIELTERCDNDCIHCCICLPEDHEEAQRREMSTVEVVELLRQACDLGALSVRFTGGEPLLREDFEDLYLAARHMGLRVLLFTNARRITPALADLFARIPPLERVEVTVYGMHAASYEAVTRRTGSFADFRRGVTLLEERGVPFVIKSAWLPPNRRESDELNAWAAGNAAMDGRPPSHSMFFELRGRRPAAAGGPVGRGVAEGGPADLGEPGDHFWWPDPARRNTMIRSLRPAPEDGVAFLADRDRGAYHAEMRQFCSTFMGAPGDMLFRCGAGLGTSVDAYGVAQMCLPLRHPDTTFDLRAGRPAGEAAPAGSPPALAPSGIARGALRAALTEFFPRVRQTRATDPDYLETCARCFLKGLCEQCPGKSWSEHGALDRRVAYLCGVAHALARDLGLLAPGERAWDLEDAAARVARL